VPIPYPDIIQTAVILTEIIQTDIQNAIKITIIQTDIQHKPICDSISCKDT
jgi:hypothetical protein